MSDRLEKKKAFIQALAKFLAGTNAARMSMWLSLPPSKPGSVGLNDVALLWRNMRIETPLWGYATVEEAEKILEEFLG
jgi:hypothetical protein